MGIVRLVRWELLLVVGMASCLRTEAPRVAPTARLVLSELAAGPRGKAPFAVVAAGPRGAVPAGDDPGVTVVFNRAMRRMDEPEEASVPPLRIATGDGRAVSGRFRWVGTRGALFEPDQPLPGASRFLVTVPAGTRALDGSALAKDYTLEFSTARPELTLAHPAMGHATVRPDDTLFLRFSQAVDPAALAGHVVLSVVTPGQKAGRRVPVKVERVAPHWAVYRAPAGEVTSPPTAFEKARAVQEPSGLWLGVVPTERLPLDSVLELVVSPGLRGLEGPLPTEDPIRLSMRTYGPLRLTDVRCARQNPGRCQAHRDFTVLLSNPVPPDEVRRFLKIRGPSRPAKPVAGLPKRLVQASTEHPLALDPTYGDAFVVTLRAGMTDVFGQRLADEVSVSLTVEEPYVAPAVKPAPWPPAQVAPRHPPPSTASGGNDAAPRRPMLKYDLELGVRGHVIEALAGAGGAAGPAPHRIPVGAVNVPTYGLYAAVLPELSTVRWLGLARGGEGEPTGPWSYAWITPGAPKNTRSVRTVDLDAVLGGNGSRGAALVSLAPLGQSGYGSPSVLSVTDLGLSARMSRFGSLVWVTRLATGTPVPDASVLVYDKSGGIVASGTTDAAGLVAFTAEQVKPVGRHGELDTSLVLVARSGEDWTYQRIEPTRAVSGTEAVDYQQKATWAGLAFTDRGVYRPGETVRVGGYFRQTARQGFEVVPGEELQYLVRDAEGELIAQGRGKLDAFGGLAASVPLSKSAAFGQAMLEVRLGRKEGEWFQTPFQILAYKPAEFKVSVDPSRLQVVHGEAVSFHVRSEYLFGAPVAGGRTEEYVTRTETHFSPPNAAGFVLDDRTFRQDLRWVTNRGAAYAQSTRALDGQGRLTNTVALDAPQQSVPEQLVYEAEVQDMSAQTQAARASVLVHPAAFYLGMKVPRKRFLAIGADAPAEVTAFDPSGVEVEGVPIELELWRRTWASVVEDRAADALHYQTYVRDQSVARCTVTSTRGGASCRMRLPEPGYYIARASARDRLGNPVYSSIGLYAVDDRADESAAPVGWREPDRRGLALEPDQKQYEPGSVARILVKSPFQEATALVTVERAGVLDRKVVSLKGRMPVVEVPVKDEYFPNAFVSVHLVRGRVAPAAPPGAADVGGPEFRIGYTSLRVDPEARRLKVSVTPARREYRPGEMVEARVVLRRSDGQPAPGSLTFFAVDEGVLMLTGFHTPDPLPAFSASRSLGVFPVESREHLARILLLQNGERVAPLGFETAADRGDKGYEVGGGEGAGRLRADFRTTAHFEAGRAVGVDGTATFRFKLPDNLTSFRLMAVAAGRDDRFGFGESSITTHRKLMARPAMPRMVRVGDRLEAGVIVTSKGLERTSVEVSLDAKGVEAVGPVRRRVVLAKNGQAEVRFPVRATKSGEASFEFLARAGSVSDGVVLKRRVEQPVRWLSAATFGSTEHASAIALGDLAKVRADRGALSVTLSSSALVGLKGVFEELVDYPYGCTEQLASRVLPVLVAPKLAEQQGVRPFSGSEPWIDEALGEIVKRQRGDGSIGAWEEDQQSEAWLTAYALLALERASQAGYFVPKRVREQAAQHLVGTLDDLTVALSTPPASDDADGEHGEGASAGERSDIALGVRELGPDEQRREKFAESSFVADVLASLGQLDEGRLRRFAAVRSRTALSSRIQLLHAMARRRMPRQELDQLLTEVLVDVAVGPHEARVTTADPALERLLESPVRTTAWMLRAVLAVDSRHKLANKLARGLVSFRDRAGYRNTQEDAWALLALEEYRQAQEKQIPNFGAALFFGDALLDEFAFRGLPIHAETAEVPMARLLRSPKAPVTVQVSGKGKVYYAVALRAARDGASTVALDEGLAIDKRLRALDPAGLERAKRVIPKRSESSARLGQLVLVDLLLESAEPRDHIVIEDPLPAGLEPVEFGFQTTAQTLARAEGARALPEGKPLPPAARYGGVATLPELHREMRDDRVLLFLPHLDAGIFHFRYLARATAPGQFVVPPTRASSMYDPEVFGQNRSSVFEVAGAR
ncbi:MAG: hypothetical protein JW751_18785 [Polyangiaceae bacterium]|nr:hypothetical protein [Polyangiaceae bacterium]